MQRKHFIRVFKHTYIYLLIYLTVLCLFFFFWLKEVLAHCPFRYYIHKLQENSLKADSNVLEVDSIFPSQDSVTITAESNNQNPSEFRAGHKNLWGFRLRHLLGVGNKLKTLPEFLLFV